MRRRRPNALTVAELLEAAERAGVDEMSPEGRRAWLNARGWTSLDYLRATLAARRARERR